MKKLSKRYINLKNSLIKPQYSIKEALSLLLSFGTAKFTESIEAHIALNINPKYAEQQIRTSLILPHGTGKLKKIAVFTEEENVRDVLLAGADFAGIDSLTEMLISEKIKFDILVTTPSLMPKLAKLGKILGPKGLMPSPKSGTVTTNLSITVTDFKKGKFEYRTDKTGVVHINFGNINFSKEHLHDNLLCIIDSILKNKPTSVKGKFFKSFTLCSTMSPGISVNINSLKI